MPFDVWLTGDRCTLRDKEGATYVRIEESDDHDGLAFIDHADEHSEDVILVPRIDYHAALGKHDVLRRYRDFVLWTGGAITDHAADDPRPWAAREASHARAVRAAERVIAEHARGPCGAHCEGNDCPGWAIFESTEHGSEVERIDQCARFEFDELAIAAAVELFDEHAPKRTTRIVIELDIEGHPDDAEAIVNNMLDAGAFQDPINQHEEDDYGPLHVVSATCRVEDAAPSNGDRAR
jgi:hypothetical protein